MADSVEYLMILNIQKITKTQSRTGSQYSSNAKDVETKFETEVVKLVIRDKQLDRLVHRGNKHLQLVTDEDCAQGS